MIATCLTKHLLIATTLLILTQLDAVPAQAQTPITSCGTEITHPGKYILINDLFCNRVGEGGPEISIHSSGVHLNLAGHVIIGVSQGLQEAGIEVSSGDVQITGPGFIGHFVRGIDIDIRQSSGPVEVTRVVAVGNRYGFDISTVGSPVSLRDNTASRNKDGFLVRSDNGQVVGNTSLDNDEIGIGIYGSRNQVSQNRVFDDVKYGIFVAGTDNQISQNIVMGGEFVDDNIPFDLFERHATCVNTWSDNKFRRANLSCIH